MVDYTSLLRELVDEARLIRRALEEITKTLQNRDSRVVQVPPHTLGQETALRRIFYPGGEPPVSAYDDDPEGRDE